LSLIAVPGKMMFRDRIEALGAFAGASWPRAGKDRAGKLLTAVLHIPRRACRARNATFAGRPRRRKRLRNAEEGAKAISTFLTDVCVSHRQEAKEGQGVIPQTYQISIASPFTCFLRGRRSIITIIEGGVPGNIANGDSDHKSMEHYQKAAPTPPWSTNKRNI
jgi:hypothetical protein